MRKAEEHELLVEGRRVGLEFENPDLYAKALWIDDTVEELMTEKVHREKIRYHNSNALNINLKNVMKKKRIKAKQLKERKTELKRLEKESEIRKEIVKFLKEKFVEA